MKTMYRLFTCTLLAVSCLMQPMDKISRKKKSDKNQPQAFTLQNWAIDAGQIILGRKEFLRGTDVIQRDKNFLKLKPDIQSRIIGALRNCTKPQNLPEISTAFKILVSSSDQLYQLINDSAFSLKLIKHYAEMLATNDALAGQIIATEGTLKRVMFQDKYSSMICSNIKLLDPLIINKFYASDFDLSFTDKNNETLGEKCVRMSNPDAILILLEKGADPEPLYNLAIQYSESEDDEDMNLMIGILEGAVKKKAAKQKK